MQLQLEQVKPRNETEMIGVVVSFLNARGYHVWRQQNTGQFDVELAIKRLLELIADHRGKLDADKLSACLRKCWRKVPSSVKGVADVIGWKLDTGSWIACEIKIGRDVIRDEQHEFLTGLKQAGGEVYVVRDFEQFVSSWERHHG